MVIRNRELGTFALVSFVVLLFVLAGVIQAQTKHVGVDTRESLDVIHNRFRDHRGLAQHHAVVFAGEITRLQKIPRAACKAGVEHRVTYRISETLWLEPDSPEAPGYIVSKGFIDCREMPLASPPFVVGANVFVYCETTRDFSCLPPIEVTNQTSMMVRSWLDELRASEGGPALLQIHERLLESAEFLRQASSGVSSASNDETSRPFVFVGNVIRVQKFRPDSPVGVASRLKMDVSVSSVLWGRYADSVVQAWCNSPQCGGVTSGDSVVMFCGATNPRAFVPTPGECSSPAPYTDDASQKLKRWLAVGD